MRNSACWKGRVEMDDEHFNMAITSMKNCIRVQLNLRLQYLWSGTGELLAEARRSVAHATGPSHVLACFITTRTPAPRPAHQTFRAHFSMLAVFWTEVLLMRM